MRQRADRDLEDRTQPARIRKRPGADRLADLRA
jgi:hypothetical protein